MKSFGTLELFVQGSKRKKGPPLSLHHAHKRIFTHHLLTDDPGSKPDQKYARRRDRQNYIRKNEG